MLINTKVDLPALQPLLKSTPCFRWEYGRCLKSMLVFAKTGQYHYSPELSVTSRFDGELRRDPFETDVEAIILQRV
jgi:hypothetical protein